MAANSGPPGPIFTPDQNLRDNGFPGFWHPHAKYSSDIGNAKKLLWADQESFLRGKKRKWKDHRRSAQRPVEETELDDLVDFINCLDEAESLPPVCVYASDLSTLPTAVIVSTSSSPSELP